MGDWNIEASEVNIWMETQGLTYEYVIYTGIQMPQ